MSDKMRNLITRALSGVVLFVVVLAAAYSGKYSYGALLGVILLVGMMEFYRIASAGGNKPQYIGGIVAGAALFIGGFAYFLGFENTLAADWALIYGSLLYLILLIPAIFIIELFKVSATPLRNIASTLMGIWYVAFPITLMLFIPLMLGGGVWRAEAFLFYLFIVWANDVFAYLVGVTMGKHRMCERISPKKSWEGFFGGVIGALGMGALGASVVGGSVAMWLGLAAIVAITGVLGDLVESMFKREAGIKDSGNILPGHGGMLDRFDAVLISSPFAFVYLIIYLM
jgi:phosphatidate cytidylyltransferase